MAGRAGNGQEGHLGSARPGDGWGRDEEVGGLQRCEAWRIGGRWPRNPNRGLDEG